MFMKAGLQVSPIFDKLKLAQVAKEVIRNEN